MKNPITKAAVVDSEGRKVPVLLVKLADEAMDEKDALDAL